MSAPSERARRLHQGVIDNIMESPATVAAADKALFDYIANLEAIRDAADAAEARAKELTAENDSINELLKDMQARLLDYWGTHGAVEGDKPGRALLAELEAARVVVEAARAVYEADDAYTNSNASGKRKRDDDLRAALDAYDGRGT